MTDDLFGRAERWTRQHPLRIGGVRLSLLVVRIVRSFLDVRVMGLAAEMTYLRNLISLRLLRESAVG